MPGLPTPLDDDATLHLVRRLRAGEPGAWDEFYRRYHDELLFTIRNGMGTRLRGFLQSEDVLQSVALEAFQAMSTFTDRGRGSLRAFLHRLIRSKLVDRGRAVTAQKRSGAVPLTPSIAADLAGAAPQYFDEERYGRIERALALLPAEMRDVIVLRRVEGCSCREAAERLGKSDDATRKLYSRALARLTGLVESTS